MQKTQQVQQMQIVINFKAYPQSTGKKAVLLAKKLIREIAKQNARRKKSGQATSNLILCPQATDITSIAALVARIPSAAKSQVSIFAQHIDPILPGAQTGYLGAAAVKSAGASGVLINHSEHRLVLGSDSNHASLSLQKIHETVQRARENKLKIIVCVRDLREAQRVLTLNPDYLALEPPELIGGSISVSSARPELIRDAHAFLAQTKSRTKLLIGAGIHTTDDVRIARDLAAHGILVASGIVLARSPQKVLAELCSGF